MRIPAKNPLLISLMGEFMRAYLPGGRNRDADTTGSYRHRINLFVTYLESEHNLTVLTMQVSDFSLEDIVSFMAWLKSERKKRGDYHQSALVRPSGILQVPLQEEYTLPR